MHVLFTDHAIMKIEQRGLEHDQVSQVALNPGQILPGNETGTFFAQSRITRNAKTYILRVTFRDEGDTRIVISAFATSQVEKYWKEVSDDKDNV